MRLFVGLAAVVLTVPRVLFAQAQMAQNPGPSAPFVTAADEATAVRANGAVPTVDGRVDDPAWDEAPALTNFRQTNPVEGAVPSESTEVRFLYTDRDLYVALRGFDREPGRVVGRLTRRDQEVAADEFTLYIDSYHDRRSAFAFTVNPSGARADVFIYEDGAGRDNSWDPVYDWATRTDSLGWSAELRIPFSQLRFPSQEQLTFGLRVKRLINRRNEEVNWPFVPRDQAGEVSRYGSLVGLSRVPAPRRLELLPYTGGNTRIRTARSTEGAARIGMDAKVGITSGLTLDATVNPDFGQVEADPSVVNLTDFETFFPEKRPFFVEGTNLFRVLLPARQGEEPLVYTRRIGRPPQLTPSGSGGRVDSVFESTILGAAKLTGQLGNGWALGLLQGVTQKENVATVSAAGVPAAVAAEPLTSYSALRIQRNTLQGRLAYGAIGTGVFRSMDEPAFNVLHQRAFSGGADLRWRFGGDVYELTSAVSGSRVEGSAAAITRTQQASARYMQRPGKTYAAIDPTRTSLSGFAAIGRVRRAVGFMTWDAVYATRSPGFEVNDFGFQRVADQHTGELNVKFRWLKPGRVFRRLEIKAGQDASSTWGWELGSSTTDLNFDGQFRNYWTWNTSLQFEPVHVDVRGLRGGPAIDVPAHGHINGTVTSDPRRSFVYELNWRSTIEAKSDKRELTLTNGVRWRPSGPVFLSLAGRFGWTGGDRQYVASGTALGTARYVLARLKRTEAAATIRSEVTLSPRLSLQLYLEPLASARHYSEFKFVGAPRSASGYVAQWDMLLPDRLTRSGPGTQARVDANRDGISEFGFADPEATTITLRSNLVLRWEFRPGSTLYLVWNQSRAREELDGHLDAARDLGNAFNVPGSHVLAVKVAYWIGL